MSLPTAPKHELVPVSLADEMRQSYLDYAMSVIVSRAIPNVCDGLKPVHRRILYAMHESGCFHNKPYRKSARITGAVMGSYHPHGNLAIYEAMVRMAQDFSMRLPLIDGQGNFGSMDGDSPAAERYTEARLAMAASALLEDIDKDTVPFSPNYDNSTQEPNVLPARFPNLLVNGAGGIAVGMATNIPPHNLGEVIDACCAYIENPALTIEDLMHYIPGPDFPTGAMIVGKAGIHEAYHTGRGSVIMRGKSHVEEKANRESIIFTEIPYQVNKSRLLERMAELVNGKVIEGISDLRDESDRDGVRVVIELKRDADAQVVLNLLHRHTAVQTSFGCNILALHDGQPKTLTLKDIIAAFINFREGVITRRTRYELQKAREKAHIYLGLAIAVAHIDEIIVLIRKAQNPQDAKEKLLARDWEASSVVPLIQMVDDVETVAPTYRLTEAQAKAILDLRLHRLTGLERDKITEDLKVLIAEIQECLKILQDRGYLFEILKSELLDVKQRFATPRRTEIIEGESSYDLEALIQREEMVITVTHNGYIKRVPLSTYRAQRRGGKGRSGMNTRDEDFVEQLFSANTHTPILFFTSLGKVYTLKVYKLPLAAPQSLGKALINILPIEKGEKITTIMPMPEEEFWPNLYMVFATDFGSIRRNNLGDFLKIRSNGKIAMKLEEQENLIGVATCTEEEDVFLTATNGRSVRFPVSDVRVFASRNSTGVRGIRLPEKARVVSMSILKSAPYSPEQREDYLRLSRLQRAGENIEQELAASTIKSMADYEAMALQEQWILTVAEKGYGKRTSAYEFRRTNRGAQGIANMDITDKTGPIVASFPVVDDEDLMLVTNTGQVIRSPMNQIRMVGRRTQGVRLFNVEQEMKVVSADSIKDSSEEGEEDLEDDEDLATDQVG